MPDSISPFDRPLTLISVFNIVYFSLISLRRDHPNNEGNEGWFPKNFKKLFISSEIFRGSKNGYVFKSAEKGIGYYLDADSASSASGGSGGGGGGSSDSSPAAEGT